MLRRGKDRAEPAGLRADLIEGNEDLVAAVVEGSAAHVETGASKRVHRGLDAIIDAKNNKVEARAGIRVRRASVEEQVPIARETARTWAVDQGEAGTAHLRVPSGAGKRAQKFVRIEEVKHFDRDGLTRGIKSDKRLAGPVTSGLRLPSNREERNIYQFDNAFTDGC